MKRLLYIIIIAFGMMWASYPVYALLSYESPGFLIVTHPEARFRTTSSPQMSLLGAANPAYPLYINGEETPVTPSGFFTAYAELEVGENIFTFENGEDTEEIIIIREEAEHGDRSPPRTEYYDFIQYGSTENRYISRFADLDDDRGMRTPLARWTTFRILGEHGDYYILEDGTAVFQSNVYLLDYVRPPVIVSNETITEYRRGMHVRLEVSDYPLYEIELDGNTARVTLYAAEIIELDYTFAGILQGFDVSFTQGTMNIRFHYAPASLEDVIILLDAGHGGGDPGALGPPSEFGPMEKDFNLYVAQVARDYLEAIGMTVIFVREDDTRIDIFDRIDYFSRFYPDMAVSVHANSMPLSSDFSSMRGPLMFITLGNSERAADNIIRFIAEETGNEYVPPIYQNFAMARYTGGASMLFEMGFLCNPEEYEDMLVPGYLDTMGISLARAIAMQFGYAVPEPEVSEPVLTVLYEEDDDEAIPAVLMTGSTYDYGLDHGINIFAAIIIGLLFIGMALFLPNKDALMKGKR